MPARRHGEAPPPVSPAAAAVRDALAEAGVRVTHRQLLVTTNALLDHLADRGVDIVGEEEPSPTSSHKGGRSGDLSPMEETLREATERAEDTVEQGGHVRAASASVISVGLRWRTCSRVSANLAFGGQPRWRQSAVWHDDPHPRR